MAIRVEINKNIVLLYALLNRFGQAFGEENSSTLRKEMIEYFRQYEGKTPDIDQYIHSSKAVSWALCVSDVPEFEKKNIKLSEKKQKEFDFGNYLKPFLLDFYNEVDFEKYYLEVLPKIEKHVDQFKEMLATKKIEEMLSATWGILSQGNMVVIPNPFTQGSFGPQIGDTTYQVIGIWDDGEIENFLHNIIHEGSHPFAKTVQKPFRELIDTKKHLLEEAKKHPKYPKEYDHWPTCFEEHLIRAVHSGIIAPKLDSDYSVEKGLQFEHDNKGMIFIKEFYDTLVDSDSVKEAIPKIAESL